MQRYRRRNSFPLFFFLALLVLASIQSASTGQQISYTPNWLHVGCSATYEFGQGEDTKGPNMVFFNQSRAFGKNIHGNYSWTVVTVEDGMARVKVAFNLVIPGSETYEEYVSKVRAHGEMPSVVEYVGKEFVELAKKGDLSFVTTLPQNQIDNKFFVVENTEQGIYEVIFWGRFHINEEFYVTLDLYNLTMVDERGAPWGKWLLWINPVFYPVDRDMKEVALYNWSGKIVERNVTYQLPGKPPFWLLVETPSGNFSEYYLGHISALQIQDPKLVSEGEAIFLMQSATYEPRIGLLLKDLGSNYVDDILAQKLGILQLYAKGHFWLTRLEGIELKPASSYVFDWARYVPYIAVAASTASAVIVYLSYRKHSRH